MKTGVYVTVFEMAEINKGAYCRCHCITCRRLGKFCGHMSCEDHALHKALGDTLFNKIQTLKSKGHEIQFFIASPRPDTRHLLLPGSRGKKLAVDRFFEIRYTEPRT